MCVHILIYQNKENMKITKKNNCMISWFHWFVMVPDIATEQWVTETAAEDSCRVCSRHWVEAVPF